MAKKDNSLQKIKILGIIKTKYLMLNKNLYLAAIKL